MAGPGQAGGRARLRASRASRCELGEGFRVGWSSRVRFPSLGGLRGGEALLSRRRAGGPRGGASGPLPGGAGGAEGGVRPPSLPVPAGAGAA